MVKRGRSRSRSRDQSPAKAPKKNPFLELTSKTSPIASDVMLQHVLTFVELSREKEMVTKCEKSLRALLKFLWKTINDDAGEPTGENMAPTEICLLLLPWAVKQLLSNAKSSPSRTVWETLHTCLAVLLLSKDATCRQTLSQKILTQSTLFKLVPKVALFAVGLDHSDEMASPSSKNDNAERDSSDGESFESDYTCDQQTQPPKLLAAKAYSLLTGKLFRPTLDVACKSLLLPIVAAMELEDQYARARILAEEHTLAGTNKVGEMVVMSTLELIDLLQRTRKSNPKTTFQLFSTRSVLLAFSRVYFFFQQDFDGLILSDIDFFEDGNEGQSLIRRVLYDVYFNPQHHIEGFRPLVLRSGEETTKKSQHQSYQEGFLVMMNEVLSPSTERAAVTDARDAVWIVPILLRGFLEQTQAWGEQQEKESRKKRAIADDVTLLQFRMFMQLAAPLRTLVAGATRKDEVSTSALALRSLREASSLVLKGDAYVYSQDDQGVSQFAFLDGIAVEILDLYGMADDYLGGLELLSDSVHVLGILAKLNHLFLHERLVPVVSFTLSCRDGRLKPQVIDFLAGAVDIYRQLREQNHLFHSVLEVVSMLATKDETKGLELLESLLNNHVLASAFATAVQDSPVLQSKAVIETINAWILGVCETGRMDDDTIIQSLGVAVQLTVLVVRNIRVDSATAAGVASLCELFVTGSIQALVGGVPANDTGPSVSKAMSPALTLCGWVIDLHTRCAFWLGKSSHLAMPSKVMQILSSASSAFHERAGSKGERRSSGARESLRAFNPILDELLFLATHRLQQLHSLVHEQERMELESPGAENTSVELAVEAEQLATFVAHVAERQRDPANTGESPRWTVIARSFTSWVPYAKDWQVDWFLSWVFSMVAIDSTSTATWLPFESLGYRQAYHGLDEEIEVATSLLHDASFLEHAKVSARIGLVALSSTSEWIASLLSTWSTGDPMADKDLRSLACSPIGAESWTMSSADSLVDLVSASVDTDRASIDDSDLLVSRLKRAILPLLAVNGMNLPTSSPEAATKYVDAAFRLDHVCRSLAGAHEKVCEAVVPLLTVLRLSVVKTIEVLPEESFLSLFGPDEELGGIISGLFMSTETLLATELYVGSDEDSRFVTATGSLVEVLSKRSCVADDILHYGVLDACVHIGSGGDSELRVRSVLGASLLRGLDDHFSEQGDGTKASKTSSVGRLSMLRDELWATFLAIDCVGSSKRDSALRCSGFLLLAELVRLSLAWALAPWPDEGSKDAIIEKCLDAATCSDRSDDEKAALSYIIACVAQVDPPASTMDKIVNLACEAETPDYLLDASFCRLVRDFDSEQLESVLEKLTSPACSYPIESRLRLTALILRYLEDEEQTETLSAFGRRIFSLVLKPLHGSIGDASWEDNVVSASSLMTDLVRRRDVVSFKERDLALTIAHISAVLGPGPADGANGGSDGAGLVSDAVYDAMVRLFASLFQRFPKQLYVCAPSVISVLHSFFRQVLYGPLKDERIVFRGQKFARICELLVHHQDVYKKHVLGLLLEFVHGLEQNMSLVRKKTLLPAIYSIIDLLTPFETKQLNSLMDTRAKALFRTIYQSYQKLHAYKGQ